MNKRTMAAATLFIAVATSGVAGAQQPVQQVTRSPGLDLGVRLGYAVPLGNADGDPGDGLSSLVSGSVPLELEVGYRLNEAFTLGGLFQYAISQIPENATTNCGTGGVSCSGSVVRLGVQGIYHFAVSGAFVPWVGLGTGYEWMTINLSGPGGTASVGVHGLEFATLQAGGDYRLGANVGLGPFVSFSFARYGSADLTTGAATVSGDVTNPTVHEWLQFGVRGTFNL